MKKSKRFLSLLLVMLMLVSFVPMMETEAEAASGSISFSDDYKQSTYYTNLQNCKLSGTQAEDLVEVAKSQVGYYGSNLKGIQNSSTSRNTEYGRWCDDSGMEWCAAFISWCARAAGIPESIIPKFIWARAYDLKNCGAAVYSWKDFKDGKVIPETGDIIIYNTSGNGGGTANVSASSSNFSLKRGSHIEIIYKYDKSSGKFYTVGGNCGNNPGVVRNRSSGFIPSSTGYALDWAYVYAIIRPAYESKCSHTWGNDGVCTKGCGTSYDYESTSVPISGSIYLNGGSIKLYKQPYAQDKKYLYETVSDTTKISASCTVVNALGAGKDDVTKKAHTWYKVSYKEGTYYAFCSYSKENSVKGKPYYVADAVKVQNNALYTTVYKGATTKEFPTSLPASNNGIWFSGKLTCLNDTFDTVTCQIKDTSGKVYYTYTSPKLNSPYFYFNKTYDGKKSVDNTLLISKLATGSYVYYITAKTSSGVTRTFDYDLKIGTGSASATVPTCKLTLNYNGGLIGKESSASVSVKQGNRVTLSSYVPTRYGYDFVGWAKKESAESADYSKDSVYSVTASTTLFAVWREIEPPATPVLTSLNQTVGTETAVTVSWRAVANANTYEAIFYNADGEAVFTAATAGTSASYIFDTAGDYTVRVKAVNVAGESEESAAADITVKAPSTVTFLNYDGSVWATQSVGYGASAKMPASPSRTGYTFDGWDGSLDNVTSDRTLTAKFTAIEYKVTFYDYNGDAASTQTVTYDGDAPGTAAEPSASELNIPEGYVLAGWDTDDWKSVTRDNIKVYPCVAWENTDIPISTEITSVTSAGSGYWVFYTVTNHVESAQSGRVVVALKSGFGKFLTKTESGAFYLDGNGSYSGNIYVPVTSNIKDETFARVEAYVVNSYTELVPISGIAQYAILEDDDSDWSAWMTQEEYDAYTGDKSETQSKTQYSTKTRSVSDWMTNESYLDWTLLDSQTVKSDWSGWSSWQDTAVTADDYTEVETQKVQTAAAYTMYRYGKYVSTAAGYGVDGDYYSSGWSHFHQGYYKTGYKLAYSSWSKTKTSPTTTKFGWWSTNNAAKTGIKSGSSYYWNKYVVSGTSYYWQETKTVAATYKTQYRYRTCTDVNQHRFYQWSDWSDWTDEAAAATDDLAVQTRTMYRVKLPASEAGDGATISGTVSIDGISDLAGRQAILNIYKVDEASDYSNEYIAQTTLGENGEYSFENVRTYEEPTIKTGDFTVTLTIEGSSGPMVLETGLFKAPKPEYQVKFVDNISNEQIGDTVTVTEGGSVTAPEVPEKEGYIFLGWEYGLTNIRDNMTIQAIYVPKTFNVIYVDFNNSTITMQTDVAYGTALNVEDPPAIEGYVFKGWKAEDGADVSCVTRSMIVTAQYDILSYTVTFLDADGNVVSTQQVEHGESAEIPEEELLNIPETMYLSDWNEDVASVTQPMEVSPVLLYEEDAPMPTADLESGIYVGAQTVTLPSYEDTTITYRLITDSSIEDENVAEEENAEDGAGAIWLDGEDGEGTEETGGMGEQIYTEPISITESSVLEVTSTKDGTNSVSETYEYIIVPEGSRPTAPAAITATAYSDRVELSWDAVESADGYIIYKSDIYGNQERLMSDSNAYTDSNVVSITDYTYTVKSYSIYTEGETETFLVSEDESVAASVRFYGEQYAVETISVEVPETVLVGNTVRLYAHVSPDNAYDNAVVWTVTNGTGSAAITESGLLTAISAGTVTVTAAAHDGSGVVGTAEITVAEASAGTAQLTVDSTSVISGKAFEVSVAISEASDVTSLQFTLLYDSTLLTLSSASAGALLTENEPEINTTTPGEVLFVWDSLEGLTDGGSILKLNFAGVSVEDSTDTLVTIPGADESDDYDFICTDSTWNEVDCTIVNGKVSILDLGYGDINGDGRVNVLDVSLARRNAARLVALEDWQLAAGDVNGDGKINIADVSLIRRYAAKLITSFPVETQEA